MTIAATATRGSPTANRIPQPAEANGAVRAAVATRSAPRGAIRSRRASSTSVDTPIATEPSKIPSAASGPCRVNPTVSRTVPFTVAPGSIRTASAPRTSPPTWASAVRRIGPFRATTLPLTSPPITIGPSSTTTSP